MQIYFFSLIRGASNFHSLILGSISIPKKAAASSSMSQARSKTEETRLFTTSNHYSSLQPALLLECEADSDDGTFCRGCLESFSFPFGLHIAFLIVRAIFISPGMECSDSPFNSNPTEIYDPQCECADAKSEGRPLSSMVPRKRVLALANFRPCATKDHC